MSLSISFFLEKKIEIEKAARYFELKNLIRYFFRKAIYV